MSEAERDFAQEILQQINKVRKFPRAYIPIMEDYVSQFKGNILYTDSNPEGILTEEGPQAVGNSSFD